MGLRYAWTDIPIYALAIVLLIPLLIHLIEIVIDYLAGAV